MFLNLKGRAKSELQVDCVFKQTDRKQIEEFVKLGVASDFDAIASAESKKYHIGDNSKGIHAYLYLDEMLERVSQNSPTPIIVIFKVS